MKKCPNCGEEILDDALICAYCEFNLATGNNFQPSKNYVKVNSSPKDNSQNPLGCCLVKIFLGLLGFSFSLIGIVSIINLFSNKQSSSNLSQTLICESTDYIQVYSIEDNMQYSFPGYTLGNSIAVKDPNFTADDAYFLAADILDSRGESIGIGVWFIVGKKNDPDNIVSINSLANEYSTWPSGLNPSLIRYRLGDPNFTRTMNSVGATKALECVNPQP